MTPWEVDDTLLVEVEIESPYAHEMVVEVDLLAALLTDKGVENTELEVAAVEAMND